MQHDVFVHPLRSRRAAYPFIAVLQSDYAEGDRRLSAPLVPRADPAPIRGIPIVLLHGRPFALNLMEIVAVPDRWLRRPAVGSLVAHHDDIIRALDWLFTGI